MSAAQGVTEARSLRSVQLQDMTCALPLSPGRKVRPTNLFFNVSIVDMHRHASTLSNLWVHIKDLHYQTILVAIPIEQKRVEMIRNDVAQAVYHIPWDKIVKNGEYIDSDVACFTRLVCSVKALVVYGESNSAKPRFATLPQTLQLQHARMEFDCCEGQARLSREVTQESTSVEIMSCEFVTPFEWESGQLHRDSLYWSMMHSTNLQCMTLLYNGPQELDVSAMAGYIRGGARIHGRDTHKHSASLFSTAAQSCHKTTLHVLTDVSSSFGTPRVSKLVEMYQYGVSADICRTATNKIDISPLVEGSMDIRFVDLHVLDAVPPENRCRLLFVLWRRNWILFKHGMSGPRFMI